MTEQQQQEFIDEHCHDTTGSKWMDQKDDEWGDKCMCIAGGGEHACYIEWDTDKNKFRFNYPCRKVIEPIKDLWAIVCDDGCSYMTTEDPSALFPRGTNGAHNKDFYISLT